MLSHLNTHSYYSLGHGVASPEEVAAAAAKMGCTALALTDINGVYGLIRFIQACTHEGVRPIVGAEVNEPLSRQRVTLLVCTREGYANLGHILSARHLNPNFSLREILLERNGGLSILSPSTSLVRDLRGKVEELGFELVAHGPIRELLKQARDMGVSPVATGRAFWTQPEDATLHRLVRAINLQTTLSRIESGVCAPANARLQTEAELREAFAVCPEAVDNANILADRCTWLPDFGTVYPNMGVDPNGRLRALAYSGAHLRYGRVDETIRERLERELALITTKHFAPVFLVAHEIVTHFGLTCGRGSAASSIVSYCLFITHVDPIAGDLFFERFLNEARMDPPDIDIDFAWDERDNVLDHVFRHYGEDRVAMVSNHVTFRPRSALREVGKVYGLHEEEIKEVASRMSFLDWGPDDDITRHPLLQHHGFPDPWPEILVAKERLQGMPRYLSVHCGGVIITPGPTADWVPVEMAAKGVRVIQWEKDQAEDAGLVKMDLLGNRSLAVIRDALANLRESGRATLEYTKFNPLEDPKTQDLISRGDTMGCFYIESPATRLLSEKAGTGDFPHLVIHSSIIRPAAARFIEQYLERLHGADWEPLHSLLAELFEDSYGIMCYQEDVSRVAMKLAGFEAGEADELRKILTKKHKQRRLADLMQQFVEGAHQRGVDDETIFRIWSMILSFSGYSFCKPHSASYALVSFKSAYLRAHYPAEFMAAVVSNQGGFYSTFAYLSEASRMGLQVLPPHINESVVTYSGGDDWVRVGLMQLKNLPRESAERIVEERIERGLYTSFAQFLRRTGLPSREVRILVRGGCCDGFGQSRPEMLGDLLGNGSWWREEEQMSLFTASPALHTHRPEYDENDRLLDELDTLGFLISRHPLSFYREQLNGRRIVNVADIRKHIGRTICIVGWRITSKTITTGEEEPSLDSGANTDDEEKHPSELMQFISFEDETGLVETVLFPKAYATYGHLVNHNQPHLIWGKVDEQWGAVTLIIERIQSLDPLRDRLMRGRARLSENIPCLP